MWPNVIDSKFFFLPQPLYTIDITSHNKLELYKDVFNQLLARTIICTNASENESNNFFLFYDFTFQSISKYFSIRKQGLNTCIITI